MPKMGRPPGPPDQVRRNRLALMFTDAEIAALHRIAERESKPLGTVTHELLAKVLRRASKRRGSA